MNDKRWLQLNLAAWWLPVCGLVAIAMIAAARIKGGYVDEYYSISFADSTVPLRQAFDAWSKDPHPIGFYAIGRLEDLVLPPDLFVRRLTNFIYFGLALFVAWSGGRGQRAFGLIFLVSLAASPYIVERFAEYRSTFLGLMIVAMIITRVRVVAHELGHGSGSLLIAVLMALLGLVDYPLAVPALALCAALTAIAAKAKQKQALLGAMIAGSACVAMLVFSILNAERFHVPYDPYFQSFSGLVRDLTIVTLTAVIPCVVMVALALLQMHQDRPSIFEAFAPTTFARILIIAILLTFVGFFLLNAATHALIRRQIFGIVPLVVAYLTEVSLPHLRARPTTIGLIAANVLIVSGASALALKSKRNFDRYGPEIAGAQHACASLHVYGLLPEWIIHRHDNRFHMPDQYAIGLEDVAHRRGFHIRLARPTGAWIDPKCGAFLWSEAVWLDGPPTTQFIASRLGLQLDPALMKSSRIEWADQESERHYSMLIRVPRPKR